MTRSSRLFSLVLVAAALTGCSRAMAPTGAAKLPASSASTASSVVPDDAKVLAEDARRATYWAGDAVRVMAVHTTALGTTALSASANVYYSDANFRRGEVAVFVARHYGLKFAAQFTELKDRGLQGLASALKPLPSGTNVTAKLAFDLAKNFKFPSTQPSQPIQPTQPTQPATGAAESLKLITGTRAILVQHGAEPIQWRFYAASLKYAINADTKEVLPPVPQVDPNDPLNGGADVAIQRASAVCLPTNIFQPNDRSAPVGTN
jgi:hypothetical protein